MNVDDHPACKTFTVHVSLPMRQTWQPESVSLSHLAADELDGSPIRRDVFSSGWKQPAARSNAFAAAQRTSLQLDSRLMPFPKGPLSFGVGVNLKMAVTRWTNWASDAGIKEERVGSGEEGCVAVSCPVHNLLISAAAFDVQHILV